MRSPTLTPVGGDDPGRTAGPATLRLVLGKLATPEVARVLLASPTSFWREGRRVTVTMLFADIRGFTSFAARVSPEESVAAINLVLEILCDVVEGERGIVNHFMGDGTLAVFGAPVALEDHAAAAARAAEKARIRVGELAAERRQKGIEPVNIGIGLNTGTVIAGCIGTPQRSEYTVVGHAVNVASRLVGIAEPGQILLGADTAALISPPLLIRDCGLVGLKGLGPTKVYELSGPRDMRPALLPDYVRGQHVAGVSGPS